MKWVKNKARKEVLKEIQLDREKTKEEIWKEPKENSNAIKSPKHSAGSCNDSFRTRHFPAPSAQLSCCKSTVCKAHVSDRVGIALFNYTFLKSIIPVAPGP